MKRFFDAARSLVLFKSEAQRAAAEQFLRMGVERKEGANPLWKDSGEWERESRRLLNESVGRGWLFGLFKSKQQRASEEYLRLLRNELQKSSRGRDMEAMQAINSRSPAVPKPVIVDWGSGAAKKMVDGLVKSGGKLNRVDDAGNAIRVHWFDSKGYGRVTELNLADADKSKRFTAEEFKKVLDGASSLTGRQLGLEAVPAKEVLSGIFGRGGSVEKIVRVKDEIQVQYRDEDGTPAVESYSLSGNDYSERVTAEEFKRLLGTNSAMAGEQLGLYDVPAQLAAYIERSHGVRLFVNGADYARNAAAINRLAPQNP